MGFRMAYTDEEAIEAWSRCASCRPRINVLVILSWNLKTGSQLFFFRDVCTAKSADGVMVS